MRMISLLLTLVVLGYVIKIYLDSSVQSNNGVEENTSRPQQAIEKADDTADNLNRLLQQQQKQLEQSGQ